MDNSNLKQALENVAQICLAAKLTYSEHQVIQKNLQDLANLILAKDAPKAAEQQ